LNSAVARAGQLHPAGAFSKKALALKHAIRPHWFPARRLAPLAQMFAASGATLVFLPLTWGRAVSDDRPAPDLNPCRCIHPPFVAGQIVNPKSSRFISIFCLLREIHFFDSRRTKAASMPRNYVFPMPSYSRYCKKYPPTPLPASCNLQRGFFRTQCIMPSRSQ
jgi:hypothetical protein